MIAVYIIELAQTDRTSPIVSTLKKDGTLSLRFNCQEMNEVTVCHLCPILRMDECINLLIHSTIFLILNAKCSYWRVVIDIIHVSLWSFTSHYDHSRFERMASGLEQINEISKGDEWLTYEIQMSFCPCVSGRYQKCFPNAIWIYRPCSISSDVTTLRH